MNTIIKFVYFDIANTLMDYNNAASYFADKIGSTTEKVLESWKYNYHDANIGKISTDEFWKYIIESCGRKFSNDVDYCLLWDEGCKPIKYAHEVFLKVCLHYEVGYFTDTIQGFLPVAKKLGLIPDFEVSKTVQSWEIGYEKTDLEAFRIAEKACGYKPEEIAFVDDNEKIVQNGKDAGWLAVNTMEELDKALEL